MNSFPLIKISFNNFKEVKNSNMYPLFEDDILSVRVSSKSIEKFYVCNNEDSLIFAHTSKRFEKIIKSNPNIVLNNNDTRFKNLKKLDWGFVLIYTKKTGNIYFYNDVFGVYPIYFNYFESGITISNNILELTKLSVEHKLNYNGIYDFILFNYSINQSTFFSGINKLAGGSEIIGDKNNIIKKRQYFQFSDIVNVNNKKELSIDLLCNYISNNIFENIDSNLPTNIALTGGFDSKLILASMFSQNINFDAYTFGKKNSIDNLIANEVTHHNNIKHSFIEITQDFENNFESYVIQFVKKTANPVLMTLIYYELVNSIIPSSNIVTGKMGGEIITGPVIISEVVATRVADTLLKSTSKKELKCELDHHIKNLPFLNHDFFMIHIDDYANHLEKYIGETVSERKHNFVNFLSQELYANFFGIVQSNLLTNYNLINPFMDLDFLEHLLNSKYSIVHNEPFTKSPISHFFSRRIYARSVERLFPSLLHSRLDRGYNLNDILKWYNIPNTIFKYISNHYFRKKPFNNSLDEKTDTSLLEKLVIDKIRESNILKLDFINKSETEKLVSKLEKGNTDRYITNKLILLLGMNYLLELSKNTEK